MEASVIATETMRRCVTLVDDEPFALDILTRAATSFHFDCQSASSAENALALLERNLTPVVVTDLRMPGHGGVWLVQEIQKRWPEVAVIVVTVGAEDDDLTRCLSAGVEHYFLKPIHIDEFHHVLQSTWYSQLIRRKQRRHRRQLEAMVQKQTHKLRRTFFSAITSRATRLTSSTERSCNTLAPSDASSSISS